MPTSCAYS